MRTLLPFIALGLLVGCADEQGMPTVDPRTTSDVVTSEQPVRVSLRFHLEGVDDVDAVALSDVFLNVGAVLLEPIDDTSGSAYASRQPFGLAFAPAHGVLDLDGPSLELPAGGAFAVSILIEPGERALYEPKDGDDAISVGLDGEFLTTTDPHADEPSPLPWRPKAFGLPLDSDRERWQAFSFRSDDAMRMQVADVRLEQGDEYVLHVSVRLGDWLRESVLPVLTASSDNAVVDTPAADVDEDEITVVDGTLAEDVELDGLLGDIDIWARAR